MHRSNHRQRPEPRTSRSRARQRPRRGAHGLETLEVRTMFSGDAFPNLGDALAGPLSDRLAEVRDQVLAASPAYLVPFIGRPLDRAAEAIDNVRMSLNNALGSLQDAAAEQVQAAIFEALGPGGLNVLGDRNGPASVGPEDVEVSIDVSDPAAPDIDVVFDLVRAADASAPIGVDFDLGLPALPVYILSDGGGVEASFGIEYRDVHFGIEDGAPFFDLGGAGDAPEISFTATAGLSDTFNLSGAFGFVHGEISAVEGAPNGVSATMTIDLREGQAPVFELAGGAQVNLRLAAEIIGPQYPGVSATLHVGWGGLDEVPTVEFQDVSVTFSSRFLAPIVEHLEPILGAAEWVVDKLNAPVPVISHLSEAVGLGRVSVMSVVEAVANWNVLSPEYDALADAIVGVVDVAGILSKLGADGDRTISLNFGSFSVLGDASDQGLAALDIAELTDEALSRLEIDGSSFDPLAFDLGWARDRIAELEELPESLRANLDELLDELENGWQVSFPMFEDPARAIFPLLLGQDADLFKVEAHFNPVADYDQSFGTPIGIDAGLRGVFEPELDLEFGLDTYGLRTYVGNLFRDGPGAADPADLLGGFYFGEDTAFRLDAGVIAEAGVNAVVFHADVSGGVLGTLAIEVPQAVRDKVDGKVRLRTDLEEDLFTIQGGISAELRASVGVGIEFPFGNFLGVEKEWVLAKKDLIRFNVDRVPNPWAPGAEEPGLGALGPDGTLQLHAGPLAGLRNHAPGILDESFHVVGEDMGSGGLAVEVFFDGRSQRFEGVTAIVGDLGVGNDSITVDLGDAGQGVLVSLQGGAGSDALSVTGAETVILQGGVGDDALTADAAGQIVLDGGDGADVLLATRAATVVAFGGTGNDALTYEGQGDASLYGDAGNDVLLGGAGVNHMEGGSGNDTLIGGSGENALYGQAGDDHLAAGPNGDLLHGGDGSDSYLAGAGDDVIFVTDTSANTTEHISWEDGDGNTTINAPNGDGINGLHVALEVVGSGRADFIRIRNAPAAGTVLIDAPGGKLITATGLDDVSLDGRAGADHVVVEALAGQDVDRIAVNIGDNLVDDRAVDLIQVFGSQGDDTLTVEPDQVILKAYDQIDTRHPENLVWGGVTVIGGMPSYTVYATNVADDLRVQAFGGADVVHVRGITGPTIVDTGVGDDVVHVSATTAGQPGVVTPDGPAAPDFVDELIVEAGAGSNVLSVDEMGSAAGDAMTVTDGRVSSGLIPGVIYRATGGGFSDVAVYGTNHDDVIRVRSTSGSVARTTILGLDGDDAFEVGSEAGTLADVRTELTLVAGSSGRSTATLTDRAATGGNADVLLAGDQVTGLAGPADDVPVRFQSWGGGLSVVVEASDDATVGERFTLDDFRRAVRIEGGRGDERFVVRDINAAAVLRGGSGADRYTIGDDLGRLAATLTIDDPAGANTVEVSDAGARGGRIYVLSGTALDVLGTAHREVVLGRTTGKLRAVTSSGSDQFRALGAPAGLSVEVDLGAGSNVLVGPHVPTRWNITGSGEVALGKLASFHGAVHLNGGSSHDRFVFAAGGKIAGHILGNAGTDTLDYSALESPVSVDLAAHTASNVGGSVFGVENVVGGAGDDVLVGDAAANQFDGRGGDDLLLGGDGDDWLLGDDGRDVLIGGPGSDRLVGGAGDDILIGGATAFDDDRKALAAIVSTWADPNVDFAGRVAALRAGTLTNATVFADAEKDILQGQRGSDWFWGFLGDALDRTTGEATH